MPDPEIPVIQRLESIIRDGVDPRMVGYRMRAIPLAKGGWAVVARIPKGSNPPHRVSTGNSNRFWVRNSGGAHEASVEELRVMFNLAADAQERIKRFRLERIAKISDGRGPIVLASGAQLAVHLVPLSGFGQPAPIDLRAVYRNRSFRPMGSTEDGLRDRFNLDGVVTLRGGDVCHGYTQVFRNGIIEATKVVKLQETGTVRKFFMPMLQPSTSLTLCRFSLMGSDLLPVFPPVIG